MKIFQIGLILIVAMLALNGCSKDENVTAAEITLQNQVGLILSYKYLYVFDEDLSGVEGSDPAFSDASRQTDGYGIGFFNLDDIYDTDSWGDSKMLYFKYLQSDSNGDYTLLGEVALECIKGEHSTSVIRLQ